MSYQINKAWLEAKGACSEGTEWFLSQKKKEADAVISALTEQGKFGWANWALVHFLSHQNLVLYSCYSARECLLAYETQVKGDSRVRDAIVAAEKWALVPTEKNKSAARSAESAAWKKILGYGAKLLRKQMKEEA